MCKKLIIKVLLGTPIIVVGSEVLATITNYLFK
jgi:hypothetical protein